MNFSCSVFLQLRIQSLSVYNYDVIFFIIISHLLLVTLKKIVNFLAS